MGGGGREDSKGRLTSSSSAVSCSTAVTFMVRRRVERARQPSWARGPIPCKEQIERRHAIVQTGLRRKVV